MSSNGNLPWRNESGDFAAAAFNGGIGVKVINVPVIGAATK